jgi:hypothetical protein
MHIQGTIHLPCLGNAKRLLPDLVIKTTAAIISVTINIQVCATGPNITVLVHPAIARYIPVIHAICPLTAKKQQQAKAIIIKGAAS